MSSYTLYQGALAVMDRLVAEFSPHIVHAFTATPDGYASVLLGRRYRIPVLCTLLGSDINVYPRYWPLTQRLTKQTLLQVDQVVTVSQRLMRSAGLLAQARYEPEVVYMGCNIEELKFDEQGRQRFRESLKIGHEARVLIFLGNLIRAKGIFVLMDAFAQLFITHSSLHLIFVGDGEDRSGIEKRVSELSLNGRVHLVGRVPHADLRGWLSAGDVFVLPSYREGLPLAVLEAMACGRPVIATRVGGIPEAVEDGESGILVGMDDVEALAAAIALLVENDSARQSMGSKGRQIVEGKFTWERSARALREIYNKVLANAQ
jgi:glycosyltransferase involved in cell wall biosynthesis